MKPQNFCKISALALGSIALAGLFASCSEDEFIANKELVEKLEKFKFSTSDEVTLDINYGPLASRALVQVYGENPLAESTADDQTPKGETVFTTFLDENGRFRDEVKIPAHVKHLYFYTGSMAAPQLMDAKLDGKEIKVTNPILTSYSTRATRVVADSELKIRELIPGEEITGSGKNFYTIVGGWDNYGNPEDPNQLFDDGHLTPDDVYSIEHHFWNGNSYDISNGKPNMDTYPYCKTIHRNMLVDNVNMVVQTECEEDGVMIPVEHAEVWFTFLTEYAWNENTVGYYFFDRNKPPQSAAEIGKKFIILPNASRISHPPFQSDSTNKNKDGYDTNHHYVDAYAPTRINQRIQLLYVDKDGKASKYFPKNTEIGFFLISNGFRSSGYKGENDGNYNTRKNRAINTGNTIYYSNYKFNSGSPQKRFVGCRLANNTVVYGAEDSSDESYDDMMFALTATPEKALHTQDGSSLTPIAPMEAPKTYTDMSEDYTYAFEDMWPDGGDYDLNDVIVHLKRTITKDKLNFVSQIKDEFTFEVNSFTNDKNAFAIQVPTSHVGNYQLPAGAWYEEETGSFFLTNDARNVNGRTLTLQRTLEDAVQFSEIQKELNPFIVNQTRGCECNQQGRIEIHLPKKGAVTSMGMQINNTKNPAKAWYISEDGLYPYAIEIPDATYEPCPERIKIGSEAGAYLQFTNWVKSNGTNYKDWYKHK